MSFLSKANLPSGKIKTAIMANIDPEITAFIKSFKIELLHTEANESIDFSISHHADVNAFHFGNGKVLLDISQKALYKNLSKRGFNVQFANKPVSGAYPSDCSLNCFSLGNKVFGKKNYADKTIIDFYGFENYVNVNQGYAKCSTCVVNENAVITDDVSIYRVCAKHNIEALLIEKGSVCLPGHKYGFIGGASALIDKNTLAFFGDITAHSNYREILSFLKKHNCDYVCLKKHKLTDIGGIIAVEEEGDVSSKV